MLLQIHYNALKVWLSEKPFLLRDNMICSVAEVAWVRGYGRGRLSEQN